MVDDWMMLMNHALLSFCHNEIMNGIVLEAISPFEMGNIFVATIFSPNRYVVNHRLPQATLSRGSPFQNGGDLDHIGRVAFEQICGIAFRMFSLHSLIKKYHSVEAFISHTDVDFICLHFSHLRARLFLR